jgi:hypothetical protein
VAEQKCWHHTWVRNSLLGHRGFKHILRVFRWNFWYTMSITMPTEISAAATLIGFWSPGASQFFPITYSFLFFVTIVPYLQHSPYSSLITSSAMWITIIIINLSPVRVYGEFEFYLAFCKVSFVRRIFGYLISETILDRSDSLFYNWWPYSRSWRVLGSRKNWLSLLARPVPSLSRTHKHWLSGVFSWVLDSYDLRRIRIWECSSGGHCWSRNSKSSKINPRCSQKKRLPGSCFSTLLRFSSFL